MEAEDLEARPMTPRSGMAACELSRHPWFFALAILSFLLFLSPLAKIVSLSWQDDRYSHLVLIPFLSLCIVFLERNRVFAECRYCPRVAAPLYALAAIFYIAQSRSSICSQNYSLSIAIFALVLTLIAGFIFCYGTRSAKAALFSLGFLLLMIPVPTDVLDRVVFGLQKGSALMTDFLFRVAGVPVFIHGFKLSLPGVDIEVAEQCSGIRSTMALFITGALAGHVYLRSAWSKTCLILLTIPIAVFKNAVRIFTISWLGVYVNRSFFYGRLHRDGGLPFSLLALALLVPLLILLQKSERRLQRG